MSIYFTSFWFCLFFFFFCYTDLFLVDPRLEAHVGSLCFQAVGDVTDYKHTTMEVLVLGFSDWVLKVQGNFYTNTDS